MVRKVLALIVWIAVALFALWAAILGLLLGLYNWELSRRCNVQSCEADWFGAMLLLVYWGSLGIVMIPVGAVAMATLGWRWLRTCLGRS
jgi:nitrate reductase gamma subunit